MNSREAMDKLHEEFRKAENKLTLMAANARSLGLKCLLDKLPESVEIRGVEVLAPFFFFEDRFTVVIEVDDENAGEKVRDSIFKGDFWKKERARNGDELRSNGLCCDRLSRKGGELHKVKIPVQFVIRFGTSKQNRKIEQG